MLSESLVYFLSSQIIIPFAFVVATELSHQSKEMYKFTLLLICFVGLVWSETCPSGQVSDCIHTSCASGSDLTCMDGLCSCTSTGPQKCISRDDCLAITNWNCREQDRHCIDNMCQCIRLP
ncbi:uncharacterized protein LOC111123424 isoform X3 [Crassostrea virginica]